MRLIWKNKLVEQKTYWLLAIATESFLVNVWNRAIQLCPVKTGELARSIRIEVIEQSSSKMHYAVVAGIGFSNGLRSAGGPGKGGSNKAYYAVYQELGFKHYRSGKFIINPYLRPAFNQFKYKYRGAVRRILK